MFGRITMLIEFSPFGWLVGLCLLGVVLVLCRQRGIYYLLFLSGFWLYMLVLVGAVFFPIWLPAAGDPYPGLAALVRQMFFSHTINLVPLYFGNCWDLPRACAAGIMDNILMTMPLGLGIHFVAPFKFKQNVLISLPVGVVIELVQFALDIGLRTSMRVVDVNDMLFNGLGVLLGAGLYLAFARGFLLIVARYRLEGRGLMFYIDQQIRAVLEK